MIHWVGRVDQPARTLSLQRSKALSGSPLGEPGTANSTLRRSGCDRDERPGPQRSTAFVKLRRETVHGEPRTARSEGARRRRELQRAPFLRLKRKDCPSFGRGDGMLRAQGRRDGRAAHGRRVMPRARSWAVRAVSIDRFLDLHPLRKPGHHSSTVKIRCVTHQHPQSVWDPSYIPGSGGGWPP